MNLDKRILNKNCIFTCFDTDKAKQYIGKQGYFANVLYYFSNLKKCTKDVLTSITEDPIGGNYYAKGYYKYFLPEDFTKVEKPKEKKFRPFKDINEFFIKTNFKAGDIIRVYYKAEEKENNVMLVGWTNDGLMLGSFYEKFNDLFEWYTLWDGEENFIPFGVLEND